MEGFIKLSKNTPCHSGLSSCHSEPFGYFDFAQYKCAQDKLHRGISLIRVLCKRSLHAPSISSGLVGPTALKSLRSFDSPSADGSLRLEELVEMTLPSLRIPCHPVLRHGIHNVILNLIQDLYRFRLGGRNDMMKGFIKLTKKTILILFFCTAVLSSLSLYFLLVHPKETEAVWFNDNWAYRKRIDVTVATNSSDISNLQMLLTVDTSTGASGIGSGKMQSSCQDLRFTNTNGKILSYYIDSGCTTTTTKIWVMVDLVPKNTTAMTLYMYYGNPSASPGSNSQPYFDNVVGLVGYWNMNESSWNGTSGEVKDMSVNGNNGTAAGNTTTTSSGQYSNAGTFDGIDDYVSVGTPTATNFGTTTSFTLSAWFKSTAASNRRIISNGHSGWHNGYYLSIGHQGDGKVSTGIGAGGSQANSLLVSTSNTFNDGNWHLASAVYDRTAGTLRIYVDGTLQNLVRYADTCGTLNTNYLDINSCTSASGTGTVNLTIGDYSTGSGEFFNGQIDDVKIYNTARTAAQILNDYNNKLPNGQTLTIASTAPTTVIPTTSIPTDANAEKAPSPAAYWKFDDGQGTSAKDSTTNSKNLTLTGSPTWQTEDMCISGKCLYFAGGSNNQYAENTSAYDIAGTALTAETWFRPNDSSDTTQVLYKQVSAGGGVEIDWTDSSNTSCYINTGSWTVATYATSNISLNKWHHIACTWNGSTITMYIDGKSVATASKSGTIGSGTYSATVGNTQNGSTTYTFKGFIDEVKIYPYARTAAQILTDYNSRGNNEGVAFSTSSNDNGGAYSSSTARSYLSDGLLGYWKFDESSGTASATDSSGNGYTGTSASTTNVGAGKFGNARTFNGSTDVITSTITTTPLTSAYTISFWASATDQTPNRDYLAFWPSGNTAILLGKDAAGIFMQHSGYFYNQGTSTLTNNTWHLITFVWDGRVGNVYVNGEVKTRYYSSTDGQIGAVASGVTPLTIGSRVTTAGSFSGSLDDLRIYNRALPPQEVSALYNFAPGPVGYWKMDEASWNGTSGEVKDASGNGNNGTGSGGVTTTNTGKYGKAGSFDGSNDYLDVADNNILDITGDIAVEAWFKPNSTSGRQDIVGKWQTGLGQAPTSRESYLLTMGVGTAGKIRFYLSTDGSTATGTSDSNTTLSAGTWYHIVGTRSGSTMTLYINGIPEVTQTLSGSLYQSDRSVLIGKGYEATDTYYTNGQIDDVKIYNYARTQKQVIEDMGGGHPAVLASSSWSGGAAGAIGSRGGGPVAYYKFDEGHSTTANNSGSGGSALNGTLTGMASPATSTSGWTQAGKFNRALNFDGSDDYIAVSDANALDLSTGFTLSSWVKITSNNVYASIVSKGGSGTSGEPHVYFLRARPSSVDQKFQIYFMDADGVADGNEHALSSNTAWTTGTWTHVVGTYDGDKLRIYINGKLDNTSSSIGENILTNTSALEIGRRFEDNANAFNGSIDEVKIYPYALTADEVKLDYNKGSAQVLGALSDKTGTGYESNQSANQEYCIPGDTSTCTAPVGRWDFEEGTGSTVNDTSGNANTGTWNGTLGSQWKTGKIGKAGNFNGSDNYVNAGTGINIANSSFTLEAWAKRSSTNTWDMIITGGGGGNNANLHFAFRDTNQFTCAFYSNDLNYTFTPDTNWHMWTCTFDASTKARRIYKDGVLVANDTSPANYQGTGTTYIGKWIDSGDYWFGGLIDQVRIFNYARSAAQIAWDYNRGAPVGHWKFNECQGDTAHDSSGNSNHGTISLSTTGTQTTAIGMGTCQTNASTPWYNGRTGKFNYSLNFDGTDDYVSIADSASLDVSQLTLSAWMYWSGNPGRPHFICKATDGSVGSYCFIIESTGKLTLFLDTGSGWTSVTSGATTIPTNTWFLATATYDGATAKIYYNGVQDGSNAFTGNPRNIADAVTIGKSISGQTNERLGG